MRASEGMAEVFRTSFLLASVGVLLAVGSSLASAQNRPNVVFILADNVGYGDMGPDKSIAFMRAQKAAGKPFFLYLPFSMGHAPRQRADWFVRTTRREPVVSPSSGCLRTSLNQSVVIAALDR